MSAGVAGRKAGWRSCRCPRSQFRRPGPSGGRRRVAGGLYRQIGGIGGPPPVVCRPPELSAVVVMTESEMFTVVPSP